MNDLVSIIVPIYNSSKYLEKCLDSILKQTYKNIEIIIIDNNSNNNDYQIIKKYNDKRIIYKKNKNNNISSSRNLGINISHGKYISFVDSDDEIYLDFINNLVKAFKNNIQLSICSYTTNKYKNTNKNFLINKKEAYKIILNKKFSGYIWNKLFLKEIIKTNKIEFDENICMGEDTLFVCTYLKFCTHISIDFNKYYFYRKHKNQITKTYDKSIKSVLNSWDKILKIYNHENPKMSNIIIFRYLKKKIELNIKTNNKISYKELNIYQRIILFIYKVFYKEIIFIKRRL